MGHAWLSRGACGRGRMTVPLRVEDVDWFKRAGDSRGGKQETECRAMEQRLEHKSSTWRLQCSGRVTGGGGRLMPEGGQSVPGGERVGQFCASENSGHSGCVKQTGGRRGPRWRRASRGVEGRRSVLWQPVAAEGKRVRQFCTCDGGTTAVAAVENGKPVGVLRGAWAGPRWACSALGRK